MWIYNCALDVFWGESIEKFGNSSLSNWIGDIQCLCYTWDILICSSARGSLVKNVFISLRFKATIWRI